MDKYRDISKISKFYVLTWSDRNNKSFVYCNPIIAHYNQKNEN